MAHQRFTNKLFRFLSILATITIPMSGFVWSLASAVDQYRRYVAPTDRHHHHRDWSMASPSNQSYAPMGVSCVAETVSEAWSSENVEATAIAWDLTQDEKVLLKALGQRIRDVDYHMNKPSEVVRYFQHWVKKKFDLDVAEKLFRKMVAWRLENDVDSILQTHSPPPEVLEYWPGAILKGLDKDGDPIFVSRKGATDGAGLLERFGKEALLKHAIWEKENMWHGEWTQQYQKEQKRPLKRLLVIEDAEGLNLIETIFNRRLVDAFSEVVRIDNDFFPQCVKKCVIIRVPKIFAAIWSVIRGLLDPLNVEKVAFSSPNRYVKDLSELVDLEVLPEEIVPGIGKGEARKGFPTSFKGGTIPVN